MPPHGVIYNAKIATFDHEQDNPLGLIQNGYVMWEDGKILSTGIGTPEEKFLRHAVDAKGKLLTPGFIDCHTHLVYGGNRAQEFEWRLQGRSYQDIAMEGGGISRTVRDTRSADLSELFDLAENRVRRLHQSGVTTLEIKSGYGLNLREELKILHVIRELNERLSLTIRSTCLAAHAVPNDFEGSHDEYIALICEHWLPEIERLGLADAVDIFCESIAFSPEHARRLFERAKSLGFDIKGHVEQLSQSHGIDVVCEFAGLSGDHLEYLDEDQVIKMRDSGVVAVMLPGAYYYLKESQRPPVEAMRRHHVPMAVATDANPGSSPLFSITLAANMACNLFGLTVEEALKGITVNAARALGLQDKKGVIKSAADADMVLWPVNDPIELIYEIPNAPPDSIWINGVRAENDK